MDEAVWALGAMTPEICFARRVIEKYELSPPIDVASLVTKYAELQYLDIPVEGVDGISLNLKVSGKRPTVIINLNNPQSRPRFTLAHELGHLLIPWHKGSFVDLLDCTEQDGDDEYWSLEREANGFAAELLMPCEWVEEVLKANSNLAKCQRHITETCEVSPLAASIRMSAFLPKNIVYACTRAGVVEFSGRTEGTLASALSRQKLLPDKPFPYAEAHYSCDFDAREMHWWRLPQKFSIAITDERDWRSILDSIVADIAIAQDDQVRFKASVNGVVANANGKVRQQGDYSVDAVVAACMQRFHGRSEFSAFVAHSAFQAFIQGKARSLVEGS